MDSTTVPPSSVSCRPSDQATDGTTLTHTLVGHLAEPARRADAARALARHLGAEDPIIFTVDPELPVLLPAPGFPQTLPQARRWHAFVAACAADSGPHVGELPRLTTGDPTSALGLRADDGAVLILLGGVPDATRLAPLRALLPVLTALCRHERAEETARGQARVAQQAAARAQMLAATLDDARRALQQALDEAEAARRRLDLLNAVSAALAAPLDDEDDESAVARVAHRLVPDLAEICLIDVVEESGTDERRTALRRVAAAHADPALAALLHDCTDRPLLLDDAPAIAHAVQTGKAQVLADLPAATSRVLLGLADDGELPPGLSLRACLIAPLAARGRTVGVLTLADTSGSRRYGAAEVALVEDLAGRCALAIENARLYRHVQQAVRTRDEFLLAASHDLKTPLTAIRGQAQLLQRRAARAGLPDAPWLDAGLTQIQQSTGTMLALLDELLDVTRVQAGTELPLDRQPVDLVAVARQVVAAQQQTTERHRLVIDTMETALVGCWDATRLTRVVGNLLANAIKYSPRGGVITVSISRAADAAGDAWAVLAVRDQGLGIPARDLPHIFDRFQRGSNVSGQIRGSGIGLASVRHIVEQHGGTISVESQETVGSTFVVRLPLAASQGPAMPPQSSPA